MNASQWASLRNDVQASIGQAPSFSAAQIEAFKTSGGYDWQSAAFRTAAPVQNHQLSLSGGDERSRYSISAGYFDQEGIVLGSDFKRISLRANYEKNYSQNFKFGVNVNYSNSVANGVGTNGSGGRTPNPLVSAVLTAPVVPIKNADGSYNVTNNIYATSVNGYVPNPINFTSIGLETNFKDLFSNNSKKPLYAFLIAQTFNVIITLLIAFLLFGK